MLFQILPSILNDWFNLDDKIRNSKSISIFKNKLLSFVRPVQSNMYNILDPKGLKFLTRLRLGLIYLNEHRFRHNLQDCMTPHVLAAWKLKIHHITFCIGIILTTNGLILWKAWNLFTIIFSLFLIIIRKMCFCTRLPFW